MLIKGRELTVLEQDEPVVEPAVGHRPHGTRPPSKACGTHGISLHQIYMSCYSQEFFLFLNFKIMTFDMYM